MGNWAQTEIPTGILISDKSIISANVPAFPIENNSADIFSTVTCWYSPGQLSWVQLNQYNPVMTRRLFVSFLGLLLNNAYWLWPIHFFQIFLPKGVTNNCAEMYLVVFCYVQLRVTLRPQKIILLLAFGYRIASNNSRDKTCLQKNKHELILISSEISPAFIYKAVYWT